MKKLLQNKKTWIIGGCAVVLVIDLILCIALAPGKSDPPIDEPTESTTDTTTSDTSTGDIVVDIPDETSESESGVDENGNIIPDGGGLVIDPSQDTSTGTTTGEKVEEPAKPVQPTEPKPDDTTSGGGIVIGTPGETPVYSCGTANHNCENEDYHKGLLAREAEGCPYCGSHSCISFYTLDQWGHTFYDPSACPKYDIHSDPAKYCQVYSNSNTSYRVKLNPSKVTETDVYFYVKAREDYVDASGNVLKYGTAKTFYIPIRPTVHRPSVTLYNFFGGAASVATPESATAPIYVGQKIMVAYGYTSDNAWYSSNFLTGTMYSWQDGMWKIVNGSADYSATRTLSKAAVARGYSTLGYFRVPDNSGAPSGNNMMFSLTSRWASDVTRTLETTTIYNPIVKSDIAITSIRLISENGYVLDSNHLQAGQNVKVMYTYKNNTDCTVYVEGYNDDKSAISGVYAIPARSSVAVYGRTITVPNQRNFSLWGGVYLEGAGIYNTAWETNGSNNAMQITCHVDHPLTLIPIEPNAAYRESTDVISSFWLVNNYTEDYTPSKNETVRFRVYKADGTLIKTVTKSQVVVPASDRNLLYFKWTVPTGLNGESVTIKADILENGTYYNVATKTYDTVSYTMYQTPDTQFEKNKPSGFNIPGDPAKSTNYATWYEYSYSGGAFIKTVYGLGLVGKTDTITPATGETAVYEGGKWTMKSGYGISVKSSTLLTTGVAGYSYAKSDAYTNPQYFRALYPEYSYKNATGCCTTLVRNGSYAELPTFMTYGKVHFTPLWFPNGNYTVSILASDCWTPAGMLTVKSVSNTITIDGSAYDDFYVGH